MTRAEAWAIVEEYVQNPNLRQHMLAVEAAMRSYATRYDGDPEAWGMAGLLHDFDWEIHPTAAEHPLQGQAILQARGVPDDLRRAIMAHAPHTGVQPVTNMEKCLYAVDEIAGFIVACALVQPDRRLDSVTVPSIQKKLRSKSFAAAVSRADIQRGWELLGRTEAEHLDFVLHALQGIHEQLGL